MTDFFKDLCAPHFWAIVITIVTMLLLVGAGVALRPALRKLLDALIKRLSGEHVEVNINAGQGEAMPGKKAECVACGLLVDPTKCPLHVSEHYRSLRNEEDIKNLWQHFEDLSKEMRAGFVGVQATITSSQATILTNQQLILAAVKKGR